jgi:FkbM family methyltransferase
MFNGTEFEKNKKHSQYGQDAFVIEYYKNKRNGVFVDIGAYDGISLSNTYYLEKELGWTGVCFEPVPAIFGMLDRNRNCIKIMAGVAEKGSVEKFTVAGCLSGISKEYDPRHVERIKREGQKVDEIEISCVTLADVLEKNNIFRIDYLSIDTEGNEFKIIKSIDFDRFDIEVITVENNYHDKEQTDYIIAKGFEFAGSLGCDEVFLKVRR